MKEFIDQWLFDPTVGKIVTAIIGILIVVAIVRFLQHAVVHRIKETDSRYRVRKFVSFLGCVLGIIVLITVFSDKLGGA